MLAQVIGGTKDNIININSNNKNVTFFSFNEESEIYFNHEKTAFDKK